MHETARFWSRVHVWLSAGILACSQARSQVEHAEEVTEPQAKWSAAALGTALLHDDLCCHPPGHSHPTSRVYLGPLVRAVLTDLQA